MNDNKQIRNSNKNNRLMGKAAEQWQEQLWEKLINKITAAKSPKATKLILENLISDYEKKMILRRLAVTGLVRTGKTYQEIGEILWMSPQTISTMKKNLLGNRNNNYKSYKHFYGGPMKYSDISKSKTIKPFFEDLFTNPPRPTGMGLKKHIK